ncbi:ABC transporter permease [Edaphobacter aggregans]|uniref:ABC transporter permease n=1 Tax=Edaphobacter aggregans TaxID=570835 RepID=UPI00054D4074|nr:ABC transporter permease [Edaphobacter aggregans]
MSRLSMGALLRRSLLHRRARSLSALVAMTVSAAVATALLTLYADLDAKLHHEFRSFGANIIVTAPSSDDAKGLPANALKRVNDVVGENAIAAEFGYAVATTDRGTPIVVAGTDFDAARRLNAWWQVDAWPTSSDSSAALVGQRAANFIADEHNVQLTFAGKPLDLHGAGRLRTGGDEDSRIYIPMAAFTAWTDTRPGVIEVQVPGGAAQVEAAITRLRQQLPEAKIEPVRQLVEGESRIVDKTHALMYGAVLLIALTVAVSVLATLSASVLERRRDFALMKALGGSQKQLMAMFLLEALVLALAGVAAGFVIGSAAAWAISQLNFHTASLPHVGVLPLVLLLNILIAVLAAVFPVRVLRTLEPAALLKGD